MVNIQTNFNSSQISVVFILKSKILTQNRYLLIYLSCLVHKQHYCHNYKFRCVNINENLKVQIQFRSQIFYVVNLEKQYLVHVSLDPEQAVALPHIQPPL